MGKTKSYAVGRPKETAAEIGRCLVGIEDKWIIVEEGCRRERVSVPKNGFCEGFEERENKGNEMELYEFVGVLS